MMDCSSSTAASCASSSSTAGAGSREATASVSFTAHHTSGQRITEISRTGPAIATERRLAFFLARIFGIVSPNMITRSVTITVAAVVHSPSDAFAAAAADSAITELMEDAATFTRLLPMRIAPSAVSK